MFVQDCCSFRYFLLLRIDFDTNPWLALIDSHNQYTFYLFVCFFFVSILHKKEFNSFKYCASWWLLFSSSFLFSKFLPVNSLIDNQIINWNKLMIYWLWSEWVWFSFHIILIHLVSQFHLHTYFLLIDFKTFTGSLAKRNKSFYFKKKLREWERETGIEKERKNSLIFLAKFLLSSVTIIIYLIFFF